MKTWWVIFDTFAGEQEWWIVVARTRLGAIRVARAEMTLRLSLHSVMEITGSTASRAFVVPARSKAS